MKAMHHISWTKRTPESNKTRVGNRGIVKSFFRERSKKTFNIVMRTLASLTLTLQDNNGAIQAPFLSRRQRYFWQNMENCH